MMVNREKRGRVDQMRKSTEKQCVGRTANFAASIRLQSAQATPPCQCYPNGLRHIE